eukprot:jgi/Mesvir1/10452/Mv12083-RA.1
MGAVRGWHARLKRKPEAESEYYKIQDARISHEGGDRDFTEALVEAVRREGGGLDMPAAQLLANTNAEEYVAPLAKPCLVVQYRHAGRDLAVTYNLKLSQKNVRFPPIKLPAVDGAEAEPKTHKILSASLGAWYPSPDNADVTEGLRKLLGEDDDFYAGAGIPQFIWCILRFLALSGKQQPADRPQFLRVIYGDGRTLIFHPATDGCIVYSGVCQTKVLKPQVVKGRYGDCG